MSDARWGDPREFDARDPGYEWSRVYDPRDRDELDPRDGLMRDLDLPRGDEPELVVYRDRVYELDGEGSRTLAVVGAFRVVPEHDLELPHDTLDNLHDQRLVELVDLGDNERGLTLTTDGRDLLDSHSPERDGEPSSVLRRRQPLTGDRPRLESLRDLRAGGSSSPRRARLPRDPTRHPRTRLEARVPGVSAGAQPQPLRQRRST